MLTAFSSMQIKRLKWHEGKAIHGHSVEDDYSFVREASLQCSLKCAERSLDMTLKPMEIRTFLVSTGEQGVNAFVRDGRTSSS